MDTYDAVKIQQFLKLSNNVTRNEVAGGTGLSRESADAALAILVASGEVSKTGEANVATYTLAGPTSTVSAPESTDRRTAEQIWSDNQRARAMADWRAGHPEEYAEPSKRYELSDEEIAAFAAAQKVTPLTPEQRRELELSTRNRTPRNPQSVIVK